MGLGNKKTSLGINSRSRSLMRGFGGLQALIGSPCHDVCRLLVFEIRSIGSVQDTYKYLFRWIFRGLATTLQNRN